MSIMNYIEEHKGTSAIIGIIIVGGIIYVASTYKSTGGSSTNRSSNVDRSRSAAGYNANVTALNLEKNKNALANNANILSYKASVNATKANIIKEYLQANVEKYNIKTNVNAQVASLRNTNMLAYDASVNKVTSNIINERLQANEYQENLQQEQNISEIGANKDIIHAKLSLIEAEKNDNTMQKIVYLNAQKGVYQSHNQAQEGIDQAYYNAQATIGAANARAGAAERESYNKYAYPAYEQMLEYIDH